MRFSLRDIARNNPQKIKSQLSLTRERFQCDACIRLQLAEVTYTLKLPVILAKSSRWKSRDRTGLHTRCEIVPNGSLLVLNLQKPTAAKALQIRSLSVFAFKAITLRNFENKLYEANASVQQNRVNTNKQLMWLKLAMKMLGER